MAANRGFLMRSVFERWIIANSMDESLAWGGSRWVRHMKGMPAEQAQISNFDTSQEAVEYAQQAHILLVSAPL